MPDLEASSSTSEKFRAANLRQRVITAVVIAAGFLALVLFSSPLWFAIISGAVFLIAAWEWSDLAGLKHRYAQVFYQFFMMLIVLILMFYKSSSASAGMVMMVGILATWALVFWATALWLVVTYPESSKYLNNANVNVFVTFLLIQPAWSALCFLKKQEPDGILILVAIAIIALADIGAYFAGVRFGKHKLAPKVSPGKSWEGFAGGMVCNLLFAAALSWHENLSLQKGAIVALVMLATTSASVVGDLFESMVKRERGVKDSGTLLPGHGGVLDRIDGWMPAIPVFTLAYLHGWIDV